MKTKLLITLLVLIGLFSATTAAQNRDVRARGLFVAGKTDAMRVVVLKAEGNSMVAVDPTRTFQKGDKIRIAFESNFPGYVYVLNVTPGGKKRVLFPYGNGNSNLIEARKSYELPQADVFVFDEEKGTEVLQVIMSREPIPFYDLAIKNSQGELDLSAANVASELSNSNIKLQKIGGGIVADNTNTISNQDTGKFRTRGIILTPGKNKEEGSYVAIPETAPTKAISQPATDGKLKQGEVAVFEIRLQHN